MTKTILTFLLIAGMVCATSLYAEIYKYTDENGQKRWTDDLSQIPPDQRQAAEQVEVEYESSILPDEILPEDALTESDEDNAQEGQKGSSGTSDAMALLEEKAQLDATRKQLLAEKEQIEAQTAEAKEADDRKALSEQIKAFNEKAQAYEKQLQEYNSKVAQYNEQINSPAKN